MDQLVTTDNYKALKVLMEKEDSPLVFTHTPFIDNGNNEAIALVRGDVPKELTILGTYDEVFASTAKTKEYKKFRDYDKVMSYTDEAGVTHEYKLPKK